MSEPFLAEIRIVTFNWNPKGWALCNGQLLPINQNQALFSLLGTNYGGDGRVTFALPDLRGRTPIHWNGAHPLGERSGAETHTLTNAQTPAHTHFPGPVATTADGDTKLPSGNRPAVSAIELYAKPGPLVQMAMSTSNVGGSQPHTNIQPCLTLNFIIALVGIFPSQN